ncbi:MAG: transcription termination/antitermination protein NusG, partial [Legionellales bacterium]|nr:transcription termination/antitermination protein NusG [Legionellales bacterium]
MSEQENSSKRWYVVHAYSGYEAFVMRELQSRIKREALES